MKMITVAFSLLLLAAPAFAKGGGTAQNHHCQKDGAEVPGKTKKECKTAGGTWDKGAPAPAPAK